MPGIFSFCFLYFFILIAGLPGVVLVLPNSYLYPETKEYGGILYFTKTFFSHLSSCLVGENLC